MTKRILLALAVASTVAHAEPINIKGSDTIFTLVQRWADAYRKQKPDAVISVTGGGSGLGIAALIAGSVDIASASRPMKEAEQEKMRSRYSAPATEIPVAKDAVAIYVNKANPLTSITEADVKLIFTGKITNWKQVGGLDAPISAFIREGGSGSYVWFHDEVLGGQEYQNIRTASGGFGMVNAVFKDANGIGYGGASLARGIKLLKIKVGSAEIECNAETMANGKYPLGRLVYFYSKKKPAGDFTGFLEFILSPEGQHIAVVAGFYPLK